MLLSSFLIIFFICNSHTQPIHTYVAGNESSAPTYNGPAYGCIIDSNYHSSGNLILLTYLQKLAIGPNSKPHGFSPHSCFLLLQGLFYYYLFTIYLFIYLLFITITVYLASDTYPQISCIKFVNVSHLANSC
jgi:hypothetical protein